MVSILTVAVAFAACGGGEEPVGLEGAERSDIPVFLPATLDSMVNVSYRLEVDRGYERFQGRTWTFWTKAPIDEVRAFYRPLAAAPAPVAEVAPPEPDVDAIDWGDEGEANEETGSVLADEDEFWAASGFEDVQFDTGGDEGGAEVEPVSDIGHPGPPLDLAAETLQLLLPVREGGVEVLVEVDVYLQPLQRRTWFTLREVQSRGIEQE